ncbi:dynein heavy chain 8, axonemal [Caerostris extrusa]|uniref:Dynein heavy chain 8, axonemal n=1 Tax=Caerostris extrusa TaxID=172846 RepID=A0AAV4PBW5_CAEEX|nr:dynein heavy chain 8, axonemal [Caerostris extrusa]
MSMGGALAGPAGTGKLKPQKTWKSLRKICCCIQLLGSNGFQSLAPGAVLTNSNRIELPVLSVAAQQISIVLSARKEKLEEFVFSDGDILGLNPEFGLFITMIIMRVKLASCGFQENSILARKFFVLYKLCEEQLTKQVDEDEPLFESLINDLFPGITKEAVEYDDLQIAIANQVKVANLINHPQWNLKVIQLYETQMVRHGMMALGPSGAGKNLLHKNSHEGHE